MNSGITKMHHQYKLSVILFLFVYLFCSGFILPQYEDLEKAPTGDEHSFEDIVPYPLHESDTGIYQGGNYSALSVITSIKEENCSLKRILSKLSASCNVDFIYDNQLLDIEGLSIEFNDEKLYEVLNSILFPFDISYYEFSPGKIALAKRKRIDESTGAVRGIIKDETGERLIGANVLIKEVAIGCATDTKGHYSIRNIKPGEYTLEASFVGYEKSSQKIKISKGEVLEINFILKSTAFQIGGIEVIGTTELLPTDVSSKTVISAGEIEHYQASSIKDVLDLVPGVQKTDNPGLGKTSQIAVRGDEGDQLSAFGTLIVVDGTPVSNNANLQFERLTGSKFGTSTMGAGIDLRTIPDDNIESIEVITGLPSVRYGDVTAGIINVQTKIGPSPHRLKIKNNPDTREGNVGGGFLIGESGLSYNFNVAQSERDIRKTGDEYLRVTGQGVYSSNLFDNQLNLNTKFNFQTIFDEEEPKGDQLKTRNYNRGFTLGFSSWGKYKPTDGVSTLEYNSFVTMRRENTMKSRLIQSDLRILPNGDTISIYLGKVETKGVEWTIGGRLEWNRVFYTGNIIHKFLIGTDPQYNVNTGQGLIVDSVLNYYGSESVRRSYSFDDIPGQLLVNLYAEDKMTGHFIFDFNLMLGLRYEMYRPEKFNLSGLWGDGNIVQSHQGTFFNPRANLMLYFTDYNQLRISAGTTSKSPSMNLIYPPETIYTWRNPIDSTINYFHYNRTASDLKGYRESQYEISYDHKFFNSLGSSISVYYKKRVNEPKTYSNPVFSVVNDGERNIAYYIDSYSLSGNSGWTDSKGIELTLKTKRIKPLNMEFQVVGAYNYLKLSTGNLSYKSDPLSSEGQFPNYQVPGTDTLIGMFYPAGERWSDRFQLNYYIKYTCSPLGLWVTLRAEQLVWEKTRNLNQAPRDLSLLTEARLIAYYFEREIKLKPNKWLFNLNVSKSLFKGAEVSFYVNNFLDDPALRKYFVSVGSQIEEIRNPSLSYGVEFSMVLDNLFKKVN